MFPHLVLPGKVVADRDRNDRPSINRWKTNIVEEGRRVEEAILQENPLRKEAQLPEIQEDNSMINCEQWCVSRALQCRNLLGDVKTRMGQMCQGLLREPDPAVVLVEVEELFCHVQEIPQVSQVVRENHLVCHALVDNISTCHRCGHFCSRVPSADISQTRLNVIGPFAKISFVDGLDQSRLGWARSTDPCQWAVYHHRQRNPRHRHPHLGAKAAARRQL